MFASSEDPFKPKARLARTPLTKPTISRLAETNWDSDDDEPDSKTVLQDKQVNVQESVSTRTPAKETTQADNSFDQEDIENVDMNMMNMARNMRGPLGGPKLARTPAKKAAIIAFGRKVRRTT